MPQIDEYEQKRKELLTALKMHKAVNQLPNIKLLIQKKKGE